MTQAAGLCLEQRQKDEEFRVSLQWLVRKSDSVVWRRPSVGGACWATNQSSWKQQQHFAAAVIRLAWKPKHERMLLEKMMVNFAISLEPD